jgi:hypothetical protein
MATAFKNKLASGLGTSPTTVVTTSASANTTVIGLSLTNMTAGIIQASIRLNDTVNSVSAYFISNVTIPPNVSLRVVTGGEKLILGYSTQVIVTSNTANSIDLVMSWVEIS